MTGLVRGSVDRPVTTLMVSLAVLLFGGVCLSRLTIDLFPEFDPPVLTVSTVYEGAGPVEIERLIGEPLERRLASVSGVEEMATRCLEGSCRVTLRLAPGTDLDEASAEVRDRVDRIRDNLPEDAEAPEVGRYDPNASPILYVAFGGFDDLQEATRVAEDVVQARLERVDGVAQVYVRGGERREIRVAVDRARLAAVGVTLEDVTAALGRANVTLPGGTYAEGNLNRLLRARGTYESLEAIEGTPLFAADDGPGVVTVGDVAEVRDTVVDRTDLTRINGSPGLLLLVTKKAQANVVDVSRRLREAVEALNASLPTGELIVRVDNADFIRESIANVRQTAVSGGLLALAVLVVFLRDWRSAAVVAIAMPLAVVATFALIYLNGFSLNVVSFGGLALGVGLLVDNSIVVLESIVRRRDLGADPKTAAVEGTSEVAGAVTASTLTTLAVFVPVLFAEGPTAVLLGQLAAVVSFSLAMSLLTSLTLTPVLAATWLKASRHSGDAGLRGVLERLLGGLDRAYAATLGGAMRSPGLVGGVLLAAACVGMGLAPRVGTELLPKADDGDLRIYGEMAPGIVLDRLDRNVREIESVANDRVPERESVLTFVGGRSDDADDWNEGNVRLKLTPRSERTRSADEIRRDLLGVFDDLPGMTVRVFRSTLTAFGRLTRGGGGSDLELIVRGYDFAEAERLCGALAETLDGVDGLIGVRVDDAPKRPELSGRVDRAEAAALGVGIESIANTIETAVRGRTATVFREGDGDEIDVNVRLREEDRDRRGDLARIRLGTPSGGLVSLGELVSFSAERTPIWFERLDRQRMWAVSADVDGRDLGSVVADTRAALAGLELPDGFTVDIGGNWEDQQDAFGQLTAGLALAIMLLYMVMASQFESLRDPLLIAATLPIAAAGVVATLVATGTTLNVQSFTGLLILAGIVVNNAIVLIDAARRIAREDPELSAAEVARLAAVRRFRPIVMTTLTTVLAMLPIAFGLGEGGELQAPLARVVVGGLIAGTLVSLLAIPLLDAAVSGRGAKPEAAV